MDGLGMFIIWVAMALVVTDRACGHSETKYKVMTTTSSVAVTWGVSQDVKVVIMGTNTTTCLVEAGQVRRICAVVGQEPGTRYDITVTDKDNWIEYYRGMHYTKPKPPTYLTQVVSDSADQIQVTWKAPEQITPVEGYILMLVRQADNITVRQDVVRSRQSTTVKRKIYLTHTYGPPTGTAYKLYVWSQTQSEKSKYIMTEVFSAPLSAPQIAEESTKRTDTAVTIQWSAPYYGDVTGYDINITLRGNPQRGLGQRTSFNVSLDGFAKEYTFQGLTPASSYDVAIWSKFNGLKSKRAQETIVYTNPSPVTGVSVSYRTTDFAVIEWSPRDPFLPRNPVYEVTARSNDHWRRETGGTSVMAQMRDLRPGRLYTVCVTIRLSTYSGPISSNPACVGIRMKPRRVDRIWFTNLDAGKVNVSWTPGQSVQDFYSIRHRRYSVTEEWSRSFISASTYIVLDGLFPGATYLFGVKAISGETDENEEEPAQEGLEMTASTSLLPLPPSSLSVQDADITDTTALLRIHFNPNVSTNVGWRVEYGLWGTGRYSSTYVPDTKSTERLANLRAGMIYTVRAFGRTNNNLQSLEACTPITFTTRPVFHARVTLRATSRSVVVSYRGRVDNFEFYRYSLGDQVQKLMAYDRAETAFHNLEPGTLYNVTGQVGSGHMLSEGKNTSILTPPEILSACSEMNLTTIKVTMKAPYGKVDSYVVRGIPITDVIPHEDTSHVIRGLQPDTSYDIRARAVRSVGRDRAESRERTIFCRTARREEE